MNARVPKAPAIDQRKLLDLQAVDSRLAQLAHRRATLPEQKELDALLAEQRSVGDTGVAARTVVGDVERLVAKAEADVQLVRDRVSRNTKRLESGAGSAKDLQLLQHELESLARRQGVLEDEELEVMERLEQAQAAAAEVAAREAEIAASVESVTTRRDEALTAISDEERGTLARREAARTGVDEGLVALYEKVRARNGGVGAALLRARRCTGCMFELSSSDVSDLRSTAPDEVVLHEECGRILVRTEESGL